MKLFILLLIITFYYDFKYCIIVLNTGKIIINMINAITIRIIEESSEE